MDIKHEILGAKRAKRAEGSEALADDPPTTLDINSSKDEIYTTMTSHHAHLMDAFLPRVISQLVLSYLSAPKLPTAYVTSPNIAGVLCGKLEEMADYGFIVLEWLMAYQSVALVRGSSKTFSDDEVLRLLETTFYQPLLDLEQWAGNLTRVVMGVHSLCATKPDLFPPTPTARTLHQIAKGKMAPPPLPPLVLSLCRALDCVLCVSVAMHTRTPINQDLNHFKRLCLLAGKFGLVSDPERDRFHHLYGTFMPVMASRQFRYVGDIQEEMAKASNNSDVVLPILHHMLSHCLHTTQDKILSSELLLLRRVLPLVLRFGEFLPSINHTVAHPLVAWQCLGLVLKQQPFAFDQGHAGRPHAGGPGLFLDEQYVFAALRPHWQADWIPEEGWAQLPAPGSCAIQ